jgi:hypothetical protein
VLAITSPMLAVVRLTEQRRRNNPVIVKLTIHIGRFAIQIVALKPQGVSLPIRVASFAPAIAEH